MVTIFIIVAVESSTFLQMRSNGYVSRIIPRSALHEQYFSEVMKMLNVFPSECELMKNKADLDFHN